MSNLSCYNECKSFFKTGKEEDLGNINVDGSCSNCLYWYSGPTSPIAENSPCPCNAVYRNITNDGTKYNLEIHNTVKKCFSDNIKKCENEYSNFTQPKKIFNPPHFGVRFKDIGKENYETQIPYGHKKVCYGITASPDFSNVGVW